MFANVRWKQHGAPIGVALGIFFLKALYLLLAPARGLAMTAWIIDDSFINMQVARMVATGRGFSFNGIDPTNGAPFLWTYITSLNHLLFPLFAAIKATFLESAFFGMLATLVCYAIAWTVTQSKAASWVALILVACTANAFLESMNGMDTAIFTFFVLLSVAAFLGVGISGIKNAFLRGSIAGVPVGLAILTRGDGIFIAAAIGLCLLYALWHDRAGRRSQLEYLGGFCLAGGLGLLILMYWGLVHAGSLFPANQVGRREIALGWHDALHGISVPKYFKVVGWNIFQLEQLLTIATGSSLLALCALLYCLTRADTRKFAIVTALYCFLFFGTLVAYQWYFPDLHGLRYINPAVHVLLILVAVACTALFTGKRRWAFLASLLLSLIALSAYSFYTEVHRLSWVNDSLSYTGFPTNAAQDHFWNFYLWTKDHLPAGSVVGVRDNGRFALFTGLPVQDLSGVIDPVIAQKVKQGGPALAAYLHQKNVSYLWIPSPDERADLLYRLLRNSLHLDLVAGAPPSVWNEHLYHIRWDLAK